MPSRRELDQEIEELDTMNYQLKLMFNELHDELDGEIYELRRADKREKRKGIDRLEKKIGKLKGKIDKLCVGRRSWAFRR